MNRALDTLCYIQEQTSFQEDYKDFGYQVHDKGDRFYVTFPAVLQSFGIKNRNGREYDQTNIWNCIQTDEYIQSMLKQNSWMGEMDHPAPEKVGEELTLQRISNPDMGRTSHYIRSPRMNGNLLEANIQTDSSNKAGMNMAIKIVDGKIIPCFSARVLGSMNPSSRRPVVFVRKLISYDWVLYPSHRESMAKINQPIQESVNEAARALGCTVVFLNELAKMAAGHSEETKMLCEAFNLTEADIVGLTSTGNSVVLTENGNTYIQPLRDANIRKKTQNELRDFFNS